MTKLFNTHLVLISMLTAMVLFGLACSPSNTPAEPIINLEPTVGGPGTIITVNGSDFPARTAVRVRLGPPAVGATPQTYGSIITDETGAFTLSFMMPGYWPDGTPITEDSLVVAVINDDASIKATAPFAYQTAVGEEVVYSDRAVVEGLDIVMMESFPVKVSAIIRGYLPDSCVSIDRLTQEQVGGGFQITIVTNHLTGVECTPVAISFEETMWLDIQGLPAGVYTVTVDHLSQTFELTTNNALPLEEPKAEPAAEPTSSLWVPVRDAQYGLGLALPCFWVIQPPPGPPSARSYDEAFAMAHSIRGQWIDQQWPSGAIKLDLIVLEFKLFGVEPATPVVEAIPQLLSDSVKTIESTTIGRHPGYLVKLATVEDLSAPDQLLVLELSPDALLLIAVYPRPALESAELGMILESLALSPEEKVQMPISPPAEPVDGRAVLFDPQAGYCFSYPSQFQLAEAGLQHGLLGPALDEGPEPVRATLRMETEPVPMQATLTQLVDEYLTPFLGIGEINRQPIQLGWEAAELVEGLPGREGSLDVFSLHDGQLVHLIFTPSVQDFPQASQDVNDLFLSVTSTFTFLSTAGRTSSEAQTLALPEANLAISLPAGNMLVKNTELFRRGSFASYDFLLPIPQVYPYLAEIQLFSRESIEQFIDRCQGAEHPCFFGDYPDVERYDAQKEALAQAQSYRDFELTQFNGRSFLVSNHNCEGVPCVVREYTTFIDNTKLDIWVMMADENQNQEADALFSQLGFQDDLSQIKSVPGPLYTLVDPGLTLHYPLDWNVLEEVGDQENFISYSVSFIPPAYAQSDQPQVPAVNLFIYQPKLVDSLWEWLHSFSTNDPFGSPAGPEIHFFGVQDVTEFRAASVFGLTFNYDVLGLPARQLLFAAGQTVVGLSYVDMSSEELAPAFAQMLSSLTLATAPSPAQTEVEYILALTNLPMYRGPAGDYQQIGQLFDGQIALVTGTSQGGQWWRVICPNDTIGDCWVSAESQLTQPTTPPTAP